MATNDKQPRWFSSGYLQQAPEGAVDEDKGIIEGVSVVTEGEAGGHGVHLDTEFVDTVIEQGNEKKQGVKARFGHPNMSSTALGTFLGRFKNFRREATIRDDGSEAVRALADLFLSNEAKETPNGNLHDYVLGMAKNEPDVFGSSIVFTPGRTYRKTETGKKVYEEFARGQDGQVLCTADGVAQFKYVDEDGNEIDTNRENVIDRDYVECEKLHGCDAVDDPAANDGFFSKFSQETVAGQVTQFLDENPQIWEILQNNDEILEAISKYGDKVSGFIRRYSEYKQKHEGTEDVAMAKESTEKQTYTSEEVEQEPQETETEQDEQAEPEQSEDTGQEEKEGTQQEQAQAIDREEFASLYEEFGGEIAAQAMLNGGGKAEAYRLKAERLEKENAELREQAKETKSEGEEPVTASKSTGSGGKVSPFKSQREQ